MRDARHNHRGGILRVLLIIFGIIFLILIAGGIYVATHWKDWTASLVNAASREVIKESGLPQDQQNTILAEIDRLADGFKNGQITTEELGRVAKAISESPLIQLAAVQMARHKYIEPSNMTPEEKADATLSIQRFARGVYEKKIDRNEVEDIIKPIIELKERGRWELKENPTRMELDQFIANVKSRADAADIPNEPFDLNIAEELKKAIQSAAR
jgi:hypothetical protein